MSREIIFRGKAISTGVFVEGSLIKKALTAKSRIVDYGVARDSCYPIEVNPETLGQYTGLKDKNGNMIFEGDILKVAEGFEHQVTWNEETASFCVLYGDNDKSDHLYGSNYGEVVGNIHES